MIIITIISLIIQIAAGKTSSSTTVAINIDRDAGFCSGSSDMGDDYHRDSNPHSPTTDASENSVDIKLTAITIPKNKRKTLEPTRVIHESDYPLKKRHKFDFQKQHLTDAPPALISPILPESGSVDAANPFRPWAAVVASAAAEAAAAAAAYVTVGFDPTEPMTLASPNPAEDLHRHPAVTTHHRVRHESGTTIGYEQEQPLALVKKCAGTHDATDKCRPTPFSFQPTRPLHLKFSDDTSSQSPITSNVCDGDTIENTLDLSQRIIAAAACNDLSDAVASPPHPSAPSSPDQHQSSAQSHRNYKNMTRERRIEANARERTRVHTISAAFETLRKSVPSYAQSQKLSKLSVLRVACSYILTLSRIAGDDYTADQSEPTVNECAEEVTRTIQTEGKVRKKKDD